MSNPYAFDPEEAVYSSMAREKLIEEQKATIRELVEGIRTALRDLNYGNPHYARAVLKDLEQKATKEGAG